MGYPAGCFFYFTGNTASCQVKDLDAGIRGMKLEAMQTRPLGSLPWNKKTPPAVSTAGDERLCCILRGTTPVLRTSFVLSSDTDLCSLPAARPYILPAVTVGLRLYLLSHREISDSRSGVSSHSLFRCLAPAGSSLNAKGIVLLPVFAFI